MVSRICFLYNKVVGYANNFITSTVCVVNMLLEYILAHAEAEGHSQVAILAKWGVECSELWGLSARTCQYPLWASNLEKT